MTKVAVLGAGSQIAARVIKALMVRPDVSVVGICRSPVTAHLITHELGCEVRVGSLSDPKQCSELLKECTAAVNLGYSLGTSKTARRANQAALENIAAQGIKRFVHMSSIAVYGGLIHHSLNMNFDQPRPDTVYGLDKLELERHVRGSFNNGTNWIILRLGAAYGAGQQTSRDFFGLATQKTFQVPFGGTRASNTIHVDVLADAIARLLTTDHGPSGVFNVADAPQTTIGELLDYHANLAGCNSPGPLPDSTTEAIINGHLAGLRRARILGAMRHAVTTGVATGVSASATGDDSRHIASVLTRHVSAPTVQAIKRLAFRPTLQRAVSVALPAIGAGLLSEAMPGPYLSDVLPLQPAAAARQEKAAETRAWYQQWAQPDWPSQR